MRERRKLRDVDSPGTLRGEVPPPPPTGGTYDRRSSSRRPRGAPAPAAATYDILLARERVAREEAEARGRRIAAQYAVSEVLSQAPGFGEAIPVILRTIGEHLEWPFVGCWCRDRDGETLRNTASWHAADLDAMELERASRDRAYRRGEGLPGRVLAAGEPEWVRDETAPTLPRFEAVLRAGLRSAFAFPIRSASEIFGVIELFHREERPPDEALLQTASAIGNQIGQFIERKRAERQLVERTRQAALDADVGAAVTAGGSLRDVLVRCAAAVVERLGAALCEAWSYDERAAELVLEAHAGGAAGADAPGARLALGAPGIGRFVKARTPVITEAVADYASVDRGWIDRGWIEREGIRAFAGLPLLVDGRLVGVLAIYFRAPVPAPMGDALASLADRVALGIDHKRREELLRRTAEAQRLLAASERAARSEAEAANRVKTQFLATMSHELRTPLNAIAGYTDLLEQGVYGQVLPEQRQALLRIQRSQRHLLGLINDILHFVKIDGGHADLAVAEVPLHALLAELEAVVRPLASAKTLRYELRPCDASLAVRADPDRVRQIALNLLTNAVKYTAPDGAITVWCEAVGTSVAVRVRDTGVGIAAPDLERVFDPFVQLGRSLSSGHHGTGLGLSISRDLARAMGGDLTVESEVGVGSTFTLVLPAA